MVCELVRKGSLMVVRKGSLTVVIKGSLTVVREGSLTVGVWVVAVVVVVAGC